MKETISSNLAAIWIGSKYCFKLVYEACSEFFDLGYRVGLIVFPIGFAVFFSNWNFLWLYVIHFIFVLWAIGKVRQNVDFWLAHFMKLKKDD